MTASAFPFDSEEHESIVTRILKFSIVIGLHLALAAWIWRAQVAASSEPVPLRMDVRTIVLPAPQPQEPPKPIAQQQKPRILQSKPSPKLAERPVVRPVAPAKAPAVQTAAPSVDPAPTNFAVAPQPSTTEKSDVRPVPAPTPVAAARFDADYLQNPAPVYPPLSRKSREEGKVLLLVHVSANGEADNVQIKQTCGFPRLDDAAMNAVRKWRFVPARRGNEAIAASVVVPIIFRLDS